MTYFVRQEDKLANIEYTGDSRILVECKAELEKAIEKASEDLPRQTMATWKAVVLAKLADAIIEARKPLKPLKLPHLTDYLFVAFQDLCELSAMTLIGKSDPEDIQRTMADPLAGGLGMIDRTIEQMEKGEIGR